MTHPAAFADAFDATVDVFVRAIESNSDPLMFAAGTRFAHLCTLTDEPRDVLLERVRDYVLWCTTRLIGRMTDVSAPWPRYSHGPSV